MNRARILILFLSLLMIFGTSCMVPHQLVKVSLTESFTQSFSFMPPGTDPNDKPKVDSIKNQLIKTLENIIRVNNDEKVTMLASVYSAESVTNQDPLIEDLLNQKIISKGVATITLALVPDSKPVRFYISGNGQYHIVNSNTSKIYYSATFWIEDSVQYLLSDYTEGQDSIIPLYFDQVLINRFAYTPNDHTAWEHKPSSSIRIDVKINRSIIDQHKKPIFGIDYDAQHRVSILGQAGTSLTRGNNEKELKQIGYIQFRKPKSQLDKVIDLRSFRLFTRKDYKKYKRAYEGN